MTKALVFVPLLLSVFGSNHAFAQNSPMHRGGPEHGGSFPALTLPVALKWQWLGEAGTKSLSSPAISNGSLFFGLGGQVFALRQSDGGQLWTYPASQKLPASFRLSPAIGDGLVYCAATDGALYALTTDTGRLVWQFHARASITTPPTFANGAVYIGTSDGRVFALDGATGNPLWPQPYSANQGIQGAILVTEGFVVALSEEGGIHGIAPATGKSRYRQRLQAVNTGTSLAGSGDYMFICSGNSLVALNPTNGRTRWVKQLGAAAALSPATDGRRVCVATEDGKLYLFDMTGKALWPKPYELPHQLEASPLLAGDTVLAPMRRGTLYAVDTGNLRLQWSYVLKPPPSLRVTSSGTTREPVWSSISAEPTVADDTLFVLTEYGQLMAFSANDAVDLTPPHVQYLIPEPGVQISGRPPIHIQIGLEDLGSGIVPDSVQLLLDGESLVPGEGSNPLFDPLRGTVLYQVRAGDLVRPIEDGRHTLEVRARDWMGNLLSRKWEVTVNNTLPPGIPRSRGTDESWGGRRGGREGGG